MFHHIGKKEVLGVKKYERGRAFPVSEIIFFVKNNGGQVESIIEHANDSALVMLIRIIERN